MESKINYPWYGTYETKAKHVEADITILYAWISNKISTREAARRIAHNNNTRVLTEEAFIKVVGELGWKKDES